MAPKSLPHKISVPGLNALFGGMSAPQADGKAVPPPAPAVESPVSTWGGAPAPSPATVPPPAPPVDPPALSAPLPPLPKLSVVAPTPEPAEGTREKRRQSKPVRVTQPESKGHPKGRHTLVIGEDVLD